jgi:hypothetical protein
VRERVEDEVGEERERWGGVGLTLVRSLIVLMIRWFHFGGVKVHEGDGVALIA